MTEAIFTQDHDALAKIFTDDLVFHLRGPAPDGRRPHRLGGFLDVSAGSSRRRTGRSSSTRSSASAPTAGPPSGSTHAGPQRRDHSSRSNAFVYRFEGDRIAEMWMFLGPLPDVAEAFFA